MTPYLVLLQLGFFRISDRRPPVVDPQVQGPRAQGVEKGASEVTLHWEYA